MSDMKPVGKTRSQAKAADLAAIGVIMPSAPQIFPLQQLLRAPENVRHTRIDEDVTALADDIAAHGLLQSLIGYVGDTSIDKNAVYIVGGGRRLQALGELKSRGLIGADFGIPVLIRDASEAIELSLAENLQQRSMSPVDEFFAFQALMENGTNSPAGLAKRFGFSERVVKQRLRLANLAEPIIDALANQTITIDTAMAYASTQDQQLQGEVFKAHSKRGAWDAHKPDAVRRDITSKGMDTSHPLFRFVTAAIYEREGGGYEDDLFNGESKERILTHPHLVESHAHIMLDFQMIGRLRDYQDRDDLASTIVGYVKIPDLRLHNWGTQAKLAVPAGFALVDRYSYDKVWTTIRNNGIDAHIVVGINNEGELAVWPRMVFVPKSQKNAVDPSQATGGGFTPPTPEETAAQERARGVEMWSRRLAMPPFAGTPFEGRAFWPDRWDDRSKTSRLGGVPGVLVSVQIFVPDEEISAAVAAAGERYDLALAAKLEEERAGREKSAAIEARKAELLAGPEFAVLVIDGQGWERQDDGSYFALGDDDAVETWSELIEIHSAADLGATFTTREEFDAAIAATASASGDGE